MAHRFLLFMVTYLHFAIVWGVLQAIDAWNSRPRPDYAGKVLAAVLLSIGILLVGNVFLLSMEFSGYTLNAKKLEVVNKRAALPEGLSVVDVYSRLTDSLPEDSVVLATPEVGWPLPTTRGKVVAVFHENPMLPDQRDRYLAALTFFERPMSERDRADMLVKYDVSHVLLKGDPVEADLQEWIDAHALRIAVVGDYRMYWLLESATESASPPEAAVEPALPQKNTEPFVAEPVVPAKSAPAPAVRPDPKPEPRLPTPVAPLVPAPAETVEPETAAFGTPIATPMIPPAGEAAVEAGVVVEPEIEKPVEKVPVSAQPEAAKPDTFGTPIAEPVLDPERHGG